MDAYDANGNMTTRLWNGVPQTLVYDHENRLVAVVVPVTATLGYDGQGNRVIRQMAGETRLYLDDYFESDTGYTSWVRYYYFGGQRVAQRTSLGVTYLHADHLGSTSETTGITTSQQLYLPYGDQRTVEEVAAEYRYTGQRWEEAIGLYDYKARYYDSELGRFIRPDTVVPEPGNPQTLTGQGDRYGHPVTGGDSRTLAALSPRRTREVAAEWERVQHDQEGDNGGAVLGGAGAACASVPTCRSR